MVSSDRIELLAWGFSVLSTQHYKRGAIELYIRFSLNDEQLRRSVNNSTKIIHAIELRYQKHKLTNSITLQSV